jgi:Zn-finger nucleic acid-binding protein
MEAHHYCGPGNIVIDTCMHCNLAWLDHGELSKITRSPGRR